VDDTDAADSDPYKAPSCHMSFLLALHGEAAETQYRHIYGCLTISFIVTYRPIPKDHHEASSKVKVS